MLTWLNDERKRKKRERESKGERTKEGERYSDKEREREREREREIKKEKETKQKKRERERESGFIWFGLVWFYGISTFVGYLMINPFFILINSSIPNKSVLHKYRV